MPLSEFAGAEPYRGILTGLNEAFLIDNATRKTLIDADPRCERLIRRNLRGQDFDRWSFDWAGFWLICIPSSENHVWDWSGAGERAEQVFEDAYPSIYAHFKPFREALIKRQDKGRHWWELRSCAYWADFDRPKIMYPEITWRAQWGVDRKNTVCNNTAYFLPSEDPWILAVANAPVTWWYSWRTAMHGKDEALRFIKDYVQTMPIPRPNEVQRATAELAVATLVEVAESHHAMRRTILDWLRVEHDIEKANLKLQSPTGLDSDAFVAEVKRIRGKKNPLSAAALKSLRDEHTRTIEPARAQAAEALQLERRLSDLVNEAYGLTPDEVALMWETAASTHAVQGTGWRRQCRRLGLARVVSTRLAACFRSGIRRYDALLRKRFTRAPAEVAITPL